MTDSRRSSRSSSAKKVLFTPSPEYIPRTKPSRNFGKPEKYPPLSKLRRSLSEEIVFEYSTPSHGVGVTAASELQLPLVTKVSDLRYPVGHSYEDLWCRVPKKDLDLSRWLISDRVLEHIARTRMVIRSLNLSHAEGISAIGLQRIMAVKGIRECDLSGAIVFDDLAARAIAQAGGTLVRLNLSGCVLTNGGMAMVANSLRSLESLGLRGCETLSDAMLRSITLLVRRHRKLMHLDMAHTCIGQSVEDVMLALVQYGSSNFVTLKIDGSLSVTDISMVALRKGMQQLAELSIPGSDIGDMAIGWIAEGCRALRVLNIAGCKRVTDGSFGPLGGALPNLTSLNVSGCTEISDAGVKYFASGFFGQLQVLDFSRCIGILGPGFEALSTKAQHLRRLYMNGMTTLDATSVAVLIRASPNIEYFEARLQLKTATKHRSSSIPKVNDEVMAAFSSAHLVELQLHGACNITDRGLEPLVRKCGNLTKLNVSHCHRITDAGLVLIAEHLRLVEEVKLAGCFEITDRGLIALAESCAQIHTLDVAGCRRITNVSVRAMCAHLKKLTKLSLAGCDAINTHGVVEIATYIPNLQMLDLGCVHDLEEEAIQQLVLNCRWLTKLTAPICTILTPTAQAQVEQHAFLARSADPTRIAALVSKPKSVTNYNRFVIGYEKYDKAARVLQYYLLQVCLPRRKLAKIKKRLREKFAQAVAKWEYLTKAMLENAAKMRFFRRLHATIVIQKFWRRTSAAKAARAIEAKRLKRLRAAVSIQSAYRRYRSKQLFIRLIHRHVATKSRWSYILSVKRYQWHIVRHMQQVKTQLVKVQTAVRAYLARQRYKQWMRNKQTVVQLRTKQLFVIYQCHMSVRGALGRLEEFQQAAQSIGPWYLALKYNYAVRQKTTKLAITYRDRYELMERSIEKIVRARRVFSMNFVINRRIAITRRRNRAAQVIQKCWRAHRRRNRSARVYSSWKRVIVWTARLYKSKCLSILNELNKERRRRRARYMAIITIQRVFRGHQGRCIFEEMKLQDRQAAAAKIQKVWWAYQWKQWRIYEKQRQEHAAYIIQKYYRAHRHHLRYANTYIRRHIAAELSNAEFKQAAILKRRHRIIKEIYERQLERHARKIQRCFREHQERELEKEQIRRKNKLRREEMLEVEQAMMLAKSKNASIGPAPPLMQLETKLLPSEKADLLKAVVQHHNLAVRQFGIVDLELTIGDKATQLFARQQDMHRKTGQSYFNRVKGDLSGSLESRVYLWYKIGEGTALFTQIRCHRAPRVSREAMRARQLKFSMEHVRMVWNSTLDFEIRAFRGILAGDEWVAVQDLRICNHDDTDAIDALLQQRFEEVASLAEYDFPTQLWMKRSIPPNAQLVQTTRANELRVHDWFNARIRHTIDAYVLSPSDVMSIRRMYEALAGAHVLDTVPVVKLSEFWNVPHTPFIGWFLKILGAESTRRFDFGDYLHLVCCFCMASTVHMNKLVFRMAMSRNDEPSLSTTELQSVFDVLYDLDVRNFYAKLSAKREFTKYSDRPYMVYHQFADLAAHNPMLMYSLTRLQHVVREQNLGAEYWLTKLDKFSQIREEFLNADP